MLAKDGIRDKMTDNLNKVLDSIIKLSNQCQQAWEEVKKLSLPISYKKAKNIVCAGMGGSGYGVRMVKSLYGNETTTRVPIEGVNNYHLPGYVNEDTLVIASSYSGNTEETLSVVVAAGKKNCHIFGITSGGKLADFLSKHNFPGYIFKPQFNPSSQPRLGQGYMLIGLIAILSRLGFIALEDEQITGLISFLRENSRNLQPKDNNNFGKKLANRLKNRIPIIIVADFLEGAAYVVRNQLNETAKQLALYYLIPELNHHLIEGLQHPCQNRQLLSFVFIDSMFYDKRNRKRMIITKEVVEKNGIDTHLFMLKGDSLLTQSMELVQFGSFLSFYLAGVNNVNPEDVPWVNYFKKKLEKL